MADGEIRQHFPTATGAPLEPNVLAELESIARMHALSAEDMYYKWDSYCIRREVDATELTLSLVRDFKRDLQDALDKSSRIRAQAREGGGGIARGVKPVGGGGDVFGMLDGLVPSTSSGPKMQRPMGGSTKRKPYETVSRVKTEPASSPATSMHNQLSSMSTLPSIPFADRPSPGEVFKVLNEHLAAATPPPAPWAEPRIKLAANSDQKKFAYKGLSMKLSEASEVLDDRIDEFVGYVQDHHGLDASEFGNPVTQATAPVVAVGRVASDALEGGGRLNAASVVLETSRRSGAGLRVPLNLGKLRSYSLFPGQIIAVRGINSSGVEFIVEEILEMPLPLSAASHPSVLDQHRSRMRGTAAPITDNGDAMMLDDDSGPSSPPPPLSVFFAAGPYTSDDNLDFEPLHELCAKAAAEHVDAVVLTGPFLDADHPLIASGDFDLPPGLASEDPDTFTLATVFKHLVSPALAHLSHANPSASIILIPSVRDVVAKHVSWPQDALCRRKDMRELNLPPKVRLVTNPITLSLNEAMLAASSLDVLFELKAEELVAGKPVGGLDPLPRLSRHVIEQRHYYPIFPPVDRSRLPKTGTADGVATGAMLDTGYLRLGEMCNVKPDIMLLPSTMPPFVETVESVLVINPGTLSKRRGAGTYARMALHPPHPKHGDPDEPVGHAVFERARVEIVKI